jgi:hypothetical protein
LWKLLLSVMVAAGTVDRSMTVKVGAERPGRGSTGHDAHGDVIRAEIGVTATLFVLKSA